MIMLSCCGLDCSGCEAFIATKNNDDALRAKVADEWARTYNAPIKPEHINCAGCRSEGVKFFYCQEMCGVRKCVNSKGLENCAGCDDYPCADLEKIFEYGSEPKNNLEALRKSCAAKRQ